MNVLALTSSYPRFEGDATAPFIESITRHIAALGHEVHLVLPEHREWNRPPVEDGVHYHPYRYSPLRTWTPWGYSESLQAGIRIRRRLYALAPLVYLSGLRACNALTSRRRFDVVQAHWVLPNGPIAAAASRRRALPLVISLHGSDISVLERSRWMSAFVRRSFAHAAAVTAPSEDLLDRARRLGASGRLELVPYGADVEAFRVDPVSVRSLREQMGLSGADVAVVGMGRFVHWKGFEYLLEAIAQARMSAPALRLLMVGDGDLREALEARARSLGLGDSVTFPGMASRDEVPTYLAAADIVAVPSVHFEGYVDGLPNVALEAMAAGKPVVASRVGGLPQVIRDGENGLLVEEQDSAALADAILGLARNPTLRVRMGESARSHIRDSLSWDATAQRFAAVFAQVTGTNRGRGSEP